MAKNFIAELRWRGMIHDMMPGTEEQFQKELTYTLPKLKEKM